jgi:hypothetical protein
MHDTESQGRTAPGSKGECWRAIHVKQTGMAISQPILIVTTRTIGAILNLGSAAGKLTRGVWGSDWHPVIDDHVGLS